VSGSKECRIVAVDWTVDTLKLDDGRTVKLTPKESERLLRLRERYQGAPIGWPWPLPPSGKIWICDGPGQKPYLIPEEG
jgi:hypothetical protein